MRIFLLALLLSGCQTRDPTGNVVDITNTDFSKSSEWKTGQACGYYFGPIGPFVDNTIVNAAANGKISKIKSVHHKFGTMIVFSWNCTMVYGE
jgi:hypothetical protein